MPQTYGASTVHSAVPRRAFRNVSSGVISFSAGGVLHSLAAKQRISLSAAEATDSETLMALLTQGIVQELTVYGATPAPPAPTPTPTSSLNLAGSVSPDFTAAVASSILGNIDGITIDSVNGHWVLPDGNRLIYPHNRLRQQPAAGATSAVTIGATIQREADSGSFGFALYTDAKSQDRTFENGIVILFEPTGLCQIYQLTHGIWSNVVDELLGGGLNQIPYPMDVNEHSYCAVLKYPTSDKLQILAYVNGNPVSAATLTQNFVTNGTIGFSTASGSVPIRIAPNSFRFDLGVDISATLPVAVQEIIQTDPEGNPILNLEPQGAPGVGVLGTLLNTQLTGNPTPGVAPAVVSGTATYITPAAIPAGATTFDQPLSFTLSGTTYAAPTMATFGGRIQMLSRVYAATGTANQWAEYGYLVPVSGGAYTSSSQGLANSHPIWSGLGLGFTWEFGLRVIDQNGIATPVTTIGHWDAPTLDVGSLALPTMPGTTNVSYSSFTPEQDPKDNSTNRFLQNVFASFTLHDSTSPLATNWAFAFVPYSRAHSALNANTPSTYTRGTPIGLDPNLFTDGSSQLIKLGSFNAGSTLDFALTIMDLAGNETPFTQSYSNFTIASVNDNSGVGSVLDLTNFSGGGAAGAVTDGNQFLHPIMSSGIQAAVDPSGNYLNVHFSGTKQASDGTFFGFGTTVTTASTSSSIYVLTTGSTFSFKVNMHLSASAEEGILLCNTAVTSGYGIRWKTDNTICIFKLVSGPPVAITDLSTITTLSQDMSWHTVSLRITVGTPNVIQAILDNNRLTVKDTALSLPGTWHGGIYTPGIVI